VGNADTISIFKLFHDFRSKILEIPLWPISAGLSSSSQPSRQIVIFDDPEIVTNYWLYGAPGRN
jgi:hypothetical protein